MMKVAEVQIPGVCVKLLFWKRGDIMRSGVREGQEQEAEEGVEREVRSTWQAEGRKTWKKCHPHEWYIWIRIDRCRYCSHRAKVKRISCTQEEEVSYYMSSKAEFKIIHICNHFWLLSNTTGCSKHQRYSTVSNDWLPVSSQRKTNQDLWAVWHSDECSQEKSRKSEVVF